MLHVQGISQAASLGEQGPIGLPTHALHPSMIAMMPQQQQQLLLQQQMGLTPLGAHLTPPLPQPQQRPVS